MSERRQIPRRVPNTGDLRRLQDERTNRRNEPVTTRTNIRPLVWVTKPAGTNVAGDQLYELYVRNPITGDEQLVAGPI